MFVRYVCQIFHSLREMVVDVIKCIGVTGNSRDITAALVMTLPSGQLFELPRNQSKYAV